MEILESGQNIGDYSELESELKNMEASLIQEVCSDCSGLIFTSCTVTGKLILKGLTQPRSVKGLLKLSILDKWYS